MRRATAPMPSHRTDDSAAGMGGLVLGIHVTGTSTIRPSDGRPPRRLSLVMREEANRYGNRSGYRMDLEGVDAPRLNPGPVPGPVIVLTRGEPVEITLVNRMTEPTAIHWHGIELESYFDGVPGWGGKPGNLAPPVAPGTILRREVRRRRGRARSFITRTGTKTSNWAAASTGRSSSSSLASATIRRPITSSSLA